MKIIVAGIGSKLSTDDDRLKMVAGKDGVVLTYANFTEFSSKLNDITRKVCRK